MWDIVYYELLEDITQSYIFYSTVRTFRNTCHDSKRSRWLDMCRYQIFNIFQFGQNSWMRQHHTSCLITWYFIAMISMLRGWYPVVHMLKYDITASSWDACMKVSFYMNLIPHTRHIHKNRKDMKIRGPLLQLKRKPPLT